jgi:hypothetical protein
MCKNLSAEKVRETPGLNSKWAERAAQLGWEAWVLFGCCRDRPLVHRDGIGLLWEVNGGRVVEVHRDWAGPSAPRS